MIVERRSETRADSFTVGVVLSDGARAEVPCLIWNSSTRGAKIEVEHPETLPERFVLDIGNYNKPKRCIVLWRIGRKVGVVFEPMAPSDTGP